MKLLITGICGFVGSTLANALLDAVPGLQLVGLDNFIHKSLWRWGFGYSL